VNFKKTDVEGPTQRATQKVRGRVAGSKVLLLMWDEGRECPNDLNGKRGLPATHGDRGQRISQEGEIGE